MVKDTLICFLHKRLLRALSAILLACFCSLQLSAQDTTSLMEVEVQIQKIRASALGKKTGQVDSLVKEQFRSQSLAELLTAASAVFIKSNGPGLLSTTAFRGGSASQTAVLWNGINIQNAMLAQIDLSLLPAFLFNKVELEYGGSSSVWGSGAMGGTIRLGSVPKLNAGLQALGSLSAGSFGKRSIGGEILFSSRRFSSSTRLYTIGADNDYDYKDATDGKIKQLQHAAYNFKGLMQDLRFILSNRQSLALSAWLGENHRKLPGFGNLISKAEQMDQTFRLGGNWDFEKKNYRTQVRVAFLQEQINYNDSAIFLYSRSNVKTIVAENEHYCSWTQNQQLNFGINYTGSFANTQNYKAKSGTERYSLLLGNRSAFLQNKLLFYVSGRLEYFSVGTLPFTWNLGTEYKLRPAFTLQLNLAEVYRQPSLNELYWLPGGNPDLKPEQGLSADGNIKYLKQKGNVSLQADLSAYSRTIDNWILWLPGAGGNPSPHNIQKVWSRGTETSFSIKARKKDLFAGVSLMSAYVLSTVLEDQNENSSAIGRQLIYTPRYSGNVQLQAGFKNLNLVYLQQYTGYRFTSSDNRNWLDPYHLSSLRLNLIQEFRKQSFTLSLACNNLFNTSYYSLLGRPMPLRHYEASLTLHFKHKKSNISQP